MCPTLKTFRQSEWVVYKKVLPGQASYIVLSWIHTHGHRDEKQVIKYDSVNEVSYFNPIRQNLTQFK